MSKPSETELQDLLQDLNPHHTTFQMDRLITVKSSAGTLYGAYRQALRELAARRDAIDESNEALELLEIEAREHESAICGDDVAPSQSERYEVLARQAWRRIRRQRERLVHVERELARFADQVRVLRDRLGDPSPEQLEQLDAEFWAESFRQRAAMELRFTGTLSLPTVEGLLSLPDEMRRELLSALPELASTFEDSAMRPGLQLEVGGGS